MAVAKTALRSTMRQRRNAIPPQVAAAAERAAAERALALPAIASAQVVGLYAAVGSELGTTALARGLLQHGAALAYPRVVPGQRRLVFHRIRGLDDLQPATFNIPEPDRAAPVVPIERIDAFVVPGLAFDFEGNRLGWGAGHYDGTLASNERAFRVGYAFELQLVHEVPRGEFDLPMDVLVTEAGTHPTNPRTPGSSR